MHINLVTDKQKKTDQQNFRTDKRGTFYGVTVKMHSPKIVLPSNYLPGNKNFPVFFSQEIITPRSIYLLVKYHSLQEIWTPL